MHKRPVEHSSIAQKCVLHSPKLQKQNKCAKNQKPQNQKYFFTKRKNIFKNLLTFVYLYAIIHKRVCETHFFGELAQLARASGSYPAGRWFKSDIRYQARWSSG